MMSKKEDAVTMTDTHAMLAKTMCSSKAEALAISRALLDARLIACANVLGPVESLFRWKGKIENDHEYMLLMKTQCKHIPEITATVNRLHSYELPELSAFPITAGAPDYIKWIVEET